MVLTGGTLIFCDTGLYDKTAMVSYAEICWPVLRVLKVPRLNKKIAIKNLQELFSHFLLKSVLSKNPNAITIPGHIMLAVSSCTQ